MLSFNALAGAPIASAGELRLLEAASGSGTASAVAGLTEAQAVAASLSCAGSSVSGITEAQAVAASATGAASAATAVTSAQALAISLACSASASASPTQALVASASLACSASAAAAAETAQVVSAPGGSGIASAASAATTTLASGASLISRGSASGAVSQALAVAASCLAIASTAIAAISVDPGGSGTVDLAAQDYGSSSAVAGVTMDQSASASLACVASTRGKPILAVAHRAVCKGAAVGVAAPVRAQELRASAYGKSDAAARLVVSIFDDLGSPVVVGTSGATVSGISISTQLGAVGRGVSKFTRLLGAKSIPGISTQLKLVFKSLMVSSAQISDAFKAALTAAGIPPQSSRSSTIVTEDCTSSGGDGKSGGVGGEPPEGAIQIEGNSWGTGSCLTAIVMGGTMSGTSGKVTRPRLNLALAAIGSGSASSSAGLGFSSGVVLGASGSGSSSFVASIEESLALAASCSGTSSGQANYPFLALGASSSGTSQSVAALALSDNLKVAASGSSLAKAQAQLSIAVSGFGAGLASFEAESGESGTALIQLRAPASICWDRATLVAYISCPDYMPAVTFEYRVVGAGSWTFGKRIAKCAQWRFTNFYAEVTGLTPSQNYEYRVLVEDVRTGTLTNASDVTAQPTWPFTTRPVSDATQFGNRQNQSGVTQATYAIPGDPTSGLITQANPRQFLSLIQRAGGTFPFDIVVFGDDNPSGNTRGTVWSYDISGNANTALVVTPNFGTDVFTAGSNPLMNGQPVRFTSTGTLPTGISSSVTYYVINRTGTTFKVSAVIDGSPLNYSTNGSGVITATVQALLFSTHYVAQAGQKLAMIGSVIGLEGYDGKRSYVDDTNTTYSPAELALLRGTGGPNGTGYIPIYREGSQNLCVFGGSSTSLTNKDFAWATTVPVNGVSIVGADLGNVDFLAVYSSSDTDSFVPGDPVFSCTANAEFGGATNVYMSNLKWASVNGNTARLGGQGQSVGTSQNTGATRPTGLLGWYGVEFRGLNENYAGLSGSLANEGGTGTGTHVRLFGDCRIDVRDSVGSWSGEHWFYTNGIGTNLSGIDDNFMLGLATRPGLWGWADATTGGFTRQPIQCEARAQPDAFKTWMLAGNPVSAAFHTYHRALVDGQDFGLASDGKTYGIQVDWVDGDASRADLWMDSCSFDGRTVTSTGALTVSVGANTLTTASLSIPLNTPVRIVTSGASVPAPVDTERPYFAVNITNGGKTFQLADRPTTTVGWQLITLTSAGVGTISAQTTANIGAANTIDGSGPIISYGFLGMIHITNVNLGRGVSCNVITNSTKGHYLYEAPDGKRYANYGVHVHSATATGSRVYSNGMLCVCSAYSIIVDSITATGISRRVISLNDDLSDGPNGNLTAAYGPTDDADVLDENGKFRCGQASASASWGAQQKVAWEFNNGANYAWTNPDVDASVAADIVRDLLGTNPVGTFGNPS